jgi:glutamate--cysteine ligase
VSPDSRSPHDGDSPVESVEDLVALLRRGEKPPERWRVGTEHEKIGLYESDRSPVPFEGERGIGALLERIAEADDWERIFEGDNTIALEKQGATITLEPGGQVELSGAPLRTVHETCDEFHTHLALMKELCGQLGIVWLGLGIHPIHGVEGIPSMPKARYRIMRRYLPKRGALALDMMYATATVQANFDFADEADMVAKMRTATGVSPIVSAIFANSSLSEGKANGFISRRLHVWQHVDPDRCGLSSPSYSSPISATGPTSSGRSTCRCSSWCGGTSTARRTASPSGSSSETGSRGFAPRWPTSSST